MYSMIGLVMAIVIFGAGGAWAGDDRDGPFSTGIEGVHPFKTGMEQRVESGGKTENPDAWTAGDTALQLVYTTLHAMDCAQTLHIARNPDRYWEEINPLLGKHPSEGRVNAYFTFSLLLNSYLPTILPKKYGLFGVDIPVRNGYQIILIGVEGLMVNRNRRIGIGINFHF